MVDKSISISLLAILFTISVANAANYFITIPGQIYRDEIIKFQLSLNPSGAASPTLFSPTVIEVSINAAAFTKSFDITSFEPVNLSLETSATALAISTASDDISIGFRFTSSDLQHHGEQFYTINLIQRNAFVFVNADKLIYRPSERVHISVVGITRELLPIPEPDNATAALEVHLIDRTGTTGATFVCSWEGEGVKYCPDGGLDVPSQNTLGMWTIQVYMQPNLNEVLAEGYFYVKELIEQSWLLNFDFTVNGNPFWILDATSDCNYRMAITAQDECGLPAQGQVDVTMMSTGGCNPIQYDEPIGPFVALPKLMETVSLSTDGSPGIITLNGLNDVLIKNNNMAKSDADWCKLQFRAKFTEAATGWTAYSESEVTIYKKAYHISLHDSSDGLELYPETRAYIRLQVTEADGSPVCAGTQVAIAIHLWTPLNEPKFLSCDSAYPDSISYSGNFNTNEFGVISFAIVTPAFLSRYRIKAGLVDHPATTFCYLRGVTSFAQGTLSSVWIHIDQPARNENPKPNDVLTFRIGTSVKTDSVFLMVKGLDEVVHLHKHTKRMAAKGLKAKVTLTEAAAPQSTAVAWVYDKTTNNIVTAGLTFKVDGFVKNKVKPHLIEASAPAHIFDKVMVMMTEGGSWMVGQAVERAIYDLCVAVGLYTTPDKVSSSIASQKMGSSSWSSWSSGWAPRAIGTLNALNTLTKLNLVGVTDGGLGTYMPPADPEETPADKIAFIFRNLASTAWIMDHTKVDPGGITFFKFSVPEEESRDYSVNALSVSDTKGIGFLQPPLNFTVGWNFVVKIDMPVRAVAVGEQVRARLILINKRSTSQGVWITIRPFPNYVVSKDDCVTFVENLDQFMFVLDPFETKSVDIWIQPISVNPEAEIVAEYLLIGSLTLANSVVTKKFEIFGIGEVIESVDAALVDPSSDDYVILKTPILHTKILKGTLRHEFLTVGSPLGPILRNFDFTALLTLPTGCGEQNMFGLSVNTFIPLLPGYTLDTAESDKVHQYIEIGVANQLNYRRNADFGFSAFGESDPASSLWLTAFVVKTFKDIQYLEDISAIPSVTHLDQVTVDYAWAFVCSRARADGLFENSGNVIHASMQGGVTDDIARAAYINMIYAVNSSPPRTPLNSWPYRTATLSALTNYVLDSDNKNPFKLALGLYSLTASNPDDISVADYNTVLTKLQNLHIEENGKVHWQLVDFMNGGVQHAGQVETAAYVLLAILNVNNVTDITYADKIVAYLNSQRNSKGGFKSTQDTVVALQALHQYSEHIFSCPTNVSVTATLNYLDSSTDVHPFDPMDATNFYNPQIYSPEKVHVMYSNWTFDGKGEVYCQMSTFYNILKFHSGHFQHCGVTEVATNDQEDPGQNTGQAAPDRSRSRVRRDLADVIPPSEDTPITTLKMCAGPYFQMQVMIIMELVMPSGFYGDYAATVAANQNNGAFTYPLKKIGIGKRRLVYYFEQLESKYCVYAKVRPIPSLDGLIRKIQPGQARVYSYYEPSQKKSVPFTFTGMRPLKDVPSTTTTTTCAPTTTTTCDKSEDEYSYYSYYSYDLDDEETTTTPKPTTTTTTQSNSDEYSYYSYYSYYSESEQSTTLPPPPSPPPSDNDDDYYEMFPDTGNNAGLSPF